MKIWSRGREECEGVRGKRGISRGDKKSKRENEEGKVEGRSNIKNK